MKKPKTPLGFIPVDSEEAKGIDDSTYVWGVFLYKGKWTQSAGATMRGFRTTDMLNPEDHYHVQLPPPVEWEEVWGWDVDDHGDMFITKHGKHFETIGNTQWREKQLNTIVAALNEMEVGNG